MDINAIHDYARRLVGAHGDKAQLEAAQRAAECEREGEKAQAGDWRRIQVGDQGDAWTACELTGRDAPASLSAGRCARRGSNEISAVERLITSARWLASAR